MKEFKSITRLSHVVLTLSVILALLAGATSIAAAADIAVDLTSDTGTYPASAAAYIDSGITVTCTDSLTGGTVNINGFVSGDTLTYIDGGGVSGSYNSSNGVLTITGTASADAYQTFLRNVKFSTGSTTGTRTIEIVLSNTSGNVMFYGGHYYQYVPTGMNWHDAKAAADLMTYPGVAGNGYLATITSAEENAFISQKLGSDAWIGGSDEAAEGTWRWLEGPEAGHLMSEYSTSWASGEPNNWSGDEDYTEIYVADGTWNDLQGAQNYGYVVEYGYTTYSLTGGSGSASKAITIVTKLTPSYTAPGDQTATYGQTLADVTLPSGFSWEASTSTSVGNVGNHIFTVKFTPDDTVTYNVVTGINVTIQVSQAIPTVTTPAPAAVTYGPAKTLNDIPLSSEWSWDSASTVPTVGNSGYAVSYTPSASELLNYDFSGIDGWNSGTDTVSRIALLTVNKALPTVTTPAPGSVTYSPTATLADITLSAGWTWDSDSTVPTVTNSGYAVTYTPADLSNYDYTDISGWDAASSTVKRTVALIVNKATPGYITPVGLTAVYGQTLADVSLPAGFTWEALTATAVGNVGSHSFTVKLTPTDTANYNSISGISVSIEVSQAIPTVNTPTPAAVTYDPAKTLNDISLSSGWSWDSASTVPTVGNSGYAVTYTPADLLNYDYTGITGWDVTGSAVKRVVSLTVNKEIPTVTTPSLSMITYDPGTTLGGITLPSGWTWDDPSVVPTTSNAGFAVTYTPADLANYDYTGIDGWNVAENAVKRVTSLSVNKADPVVTWPTIGAITYGHTFRNAVGTNGLSDIAGDFVIEDPAVIPAAAGSPYSKTLYFEPSYAECYNTLSTPAVITVNKADAVLGDIVCADRTYNALPLSPSAIIISGEGTILFTYSGTGITGTTSVAPTGAGIYIITATLPASSNFNEAVKIKTGVAIWHRSSSTKPTADVVVNGETQSADIKTGTNAEGQSVTTVTLDPAKVIAQLEENNSNPNIVIPVSGGADVAVGGLTGDMIKTMETKDATVELKTETETYTVPASEINIDAVSKQFGQSVALSDIDVHISISKPSGDTVKVVADAAAAGGFSISVPAVNFSISCTYGGKTVDIRHFNAYVERTVAIPAGIDASRITTAIVVDADGTTRQVPTKITLVDGKYYAVINSLTNSTYAVIWNPVAFSDVASHWAKDSVNDMGSRLIVSGVDENNYKPDRDITRAEFAAIMVRALGLVPGTGETGFSDVKASAWYAGYVQTAAEYGIISGYSDTAFGPADRITREQAMSMIARAAKITGLDASVEESQIDSILAGFADAASVSNYARSSIALCIEAGLVSGKSSSAVAPKEDITRAEVAVIVEKLLRQSDLI